MPRTEEPGGLQSVGLQSRHGWSTHTHNQTIACTQQKVGLFPLNCSIRFWKQKVVLESDCESRRELHQDKKCAYIGIWEETYYGVKKSVLGSDMPCASYARPSVSVFTFLKLSTVTGIKCRYPLHGAFWGWNKSVGNVPPGLTHSKCSGK